jgi:hypothetical protein
MQLKIIPVLEEQVAANFTGKINILATFNHQYLGHILFKNGELLQVFFQGQQGLKAFYQIIIREFSLPSFDYVVEPEIVEEKERQIHYPFAVLKNKMADILKMHRESLKLRPPENVRILLDADFLDDTLPVSSEEFEVMKTLTEWNTPLDVYQHCSLLDYEVTQALVSLRKKGALKILASKSNP